MKNYEFDTLIIGCGISGLSCAISLAEKGERVSLVTREKDPLISNTYFAQGGIIYPQNDESLVGDILKASAGTAYCKAAHFLNDESGKILEELLLKKASPQFARSSSGELLYTKEAAHSKARILYKGDFTGKEIQISLLNYLKDKKRFPHVSIFSSHTAIDLITPAHHGVSLEQRYEKNAVVGAYILDQKNNSVLKFMAKKTVLATGGLGALYLHNSNSDGARGDGHAMAKRAGAFMSNMEFIQFHPTTFYSPQGHRRFLISEAIRGEGGILLNSDGKAFMANYHVDKEMAPRDIVARAILAESMKTQTECVYLDISHKNKKWLKERFPTIYEHCLDNNIDITKEAIPVVPAAHYACGGVKADFSGQTNIPNLFAVGEVACTGLHGANRLASTSLLEGLTWGNKAAKRILEENKKAKIYDQKKIKDWEIGSRVADPALIHQDWMTLKQTMWNYVGLIRSNQRLGRAHGMFNELEAEVGYFYRQARLTDGLIGLRNGVESAIMVLAASERNRESIGCFYRED